MTAARHWAPDARRHRLRGELRPGQPERALRGVRLGRPRALDERRSLGDDLQPHRSGRYTFSPVTQERQDAHLPRRRERRRRQPTGAQVYRVDDASQPAATLTASNNAAWTRLSNPTPGTPGQRGLELLQQPLVGRSASTTCTSLSPADHPDVVVVSGLMHYDELKPYAAPGGIAPTAASVLMSTDAGATWTDMTGDPQGESMHPDQHAVVFVPGNPNQFFAGSDGGVIRTNGKFVDVRACATAAASAPRSWPTASRGSAASRRSSSR